MNTGKVTELGFGNDAILDAWKRLCDTVIANGGKISDMDPFIRKDGQVMVDFIARTLVRIGAVVRDEYHVSVMPAESYDVQFTSLIKPEHNIRVSRNITPGNFPGECISTFETTLLHFDRSISSDEAIQEMNLMGLQPASMIELLAFRASYLKTWTIPIIGLGSVWVDPDGVHYVGCVNDMPSQLRVNLFDRADRWLSHYHFLAVANSLTA